MASERFNDWAGATTNARRVDRYILIGSLLLAALQGYGMATAQWVVHRDPRWFDAPLEFRPERWENGLAKQLPRFAYFPFGGGPRQCIGNTFALMEAGIVLATIAQKFRLRLVPGHPVTPMASITMRPRNGIRVKLEKRAGLARNS